MRNIVVGQFIQTLEEIIMFQLLEFTQYYSKIFSSLQKKRGRFTTASVLN